MTRRNYYVYELVDPRDGEVFYVGKGSGARSLMHARLARKGIVDNGPKCLRIQRIQQAGLEVLERIVGNGFTEDESYEAERVHIHSFPPAQLTNKLRAQDHASLAKARSQFLLNLLKSYEAWSASVPYAVEAVRRVFGDPQEFYERFKQELGAI